MSTTTLTETTTPSTAEQQHVYGCLHIEHLLKTHGDRTRQEYDSVMSVVIQPSTPKTVKVKVFTLEAVDVDVS
jgi:hypothetical protein